MTKLEIVELMNRPILEVTGSNRLMAYLTERNIEYIRIEAEAMTPEEAKRIWDEIASNWRGVCFRAGTGSWTSRIEWTLLLRKMVLIQRKAEAED